MRLVAALLFALLPAGPVLADFDALLTAARTNDLAGVQAELALGTSPNPPSYHTSYVPLQFATQHGDAEMVRLLLAAGADTEYRDHNGDRALLWAASEGHAEVVRLLLAAGSPPDSDLDPYGETPLMEASTYAHDDVAVLLLAAGADPNRREQIGVTALHYAARTDNVALVGALLTAGANPNVFDEVSFDTPLHEAAGSSRDPRILQLLLDASAAPYPRNREGKTPLHLAAERGRAGNVAVLLATWAEFDVKDAAGRTPIIAAMTQPVDKDSDRDQAVLLLAEQTADLDRAFAAALRTGYPIAAARLLSRGASVDALDEDGRPALANSPRRGHGDVPAAHRARRGRGPPWPRGIARRRRLRASRHCPRPGRTRGSGRQPRCGRRHAAASGGKGRACRHGRVSAGRWRRAGCGR